MEVIANSTAGSRACPFRAADLAPRRLEPNPEYARLREEQPLARVIMPYGGEAWLATRYADVRAVLADPRFSRAAAVGETAPRNVPVDQQGGSLLGLDPPRHTRLRRLVAKAFTARRTETLRPRVQAIVDGLLDGLTGSAAPADLSADLAWPLGITVICETLGVPAADRDRFRTWTDQLVALTAADPDVIIAARENLDAYLGDLVARRRAAPADDLLGDLILARDEHGRLSESELVASIVTLLVAGHETTANQLGNFAYTLLSEHSWWESLVADPALVPAAVEELLRYTPLESSVGFFARIATEPVELAGQTIAAGEAVVAQLSSANRDAAVFTEPDRLDLARPANPHVAFGHGPHHCIGAQLARLELRVALDTLVRRLPGLRLAVPAQDVRWVVDRVMLGPRELPVAW